MTYPDLALDTTVKFFGLKKAIKREGLGDSAFLELKKAETETEVIDMAEMYDFSKGGVYRIAMQGSIPFGGKKDKKGKKCKKCKKNRIIGSIPYSSNTIEVNVSAARVETIRQKLLHKQSRISSLAHCTDQDVFIIQKLRSKCASVAEKAQETIKSGKTNALRKHFKSDDEETRETVLSVFENMAKECRGDEGSTLEFICRNGNNKCGPGVHAYISPFLSKLVFCKAHFKSPQREKKCKGDSISQMETTVRLMTQLWRTNATVDASYGTKGTKELDKHESLDSGDAYASFARDVLLNCSD